MAVFSQSPTINEIRFEAFESPVGETLLASVELVNTSGTSIDLTGYQLTNELASSITTLPSWILPDGAYLTIHFGTGTNDSDFSNDWGHFYTQGSQDVFNGDEDAVALYYPSIDPTSIIDYVNWSSTGSFTPGQANINAVTIGIWGDLDFVDAAAWPLNSTMGLSPDGYDNNISADWNEILWVTQIAGPNDPANPFLIAPANGFVHIPNLVNFVWNNVPSALNFNLQIALDPDFIVIVDDQNLNDPFAIVNLPNGVYFWRVIVTGPTGVIHNPNPESWIVIIGQQNPDPANSKLLSVPHYFQHKDSEMLCLTFDKGYPSPPLRRHGCNENGGAHGPWDGGHPANHATNCNHCNMYCIRASIQMINHFHRGGGANLTQDRISYQALNGLHPGPEQDLGHNRGMLWATETPQTYGWALGTGSTQDNSPTFAEMKAEINAGRPVLVGNGHHAMVISGWRTVNGINQIHLLDPWPTAPSGWMNWNVKGLNKWYTVNGPVAAINQEASVSMDSDGDDVTDFCETVRGFCSSHTNPDSDSDGINDKKEIRSYTFHHIDHAPGHLNVMGLFISTNSAQFPDIDMDGSRAECDCDTDGDGDLDGDEDINVNGKSPEANETCVYDFLEYDVELTLNMECYSPEDNVLLSGQTFSANWVYGFEVIDDCVPQSDGTPINPGASGFVSTDGEGKFENHDLGTFDVGWYQVLFDVDGDGVFNSIGCPDQAICFEVKATGCCWNCEAYILTCDGPMFEDDCDEEWNWVEDADCDTEECALAGCMDSTACNYDSNAVCDDGSCYNYGCTDPYACNWDVTAYCDDDSCYYYGCTDSTACNWDSYAGCDDDSCYYSGCMDYYACNYDSTAGCDDDSCYYGTCMDPEACNYDNSGQCEDNSQCHYYGCDDPAACNYDPDSYCGTMGFCEYENCGGCLDSYACNYNSQVSYDDGSCVYPGCLDTAACNYDFLAGCDEPFLCIYPGCQDISACNYDPVAECDDGMCIYYGCTDTTACNYDMTAGCDDGSCTYYGCTYSGACNFDPSAACDDGSCAYSGCMDLLANNYDMYAACDDGSCTYDPYGCNDTAACNYDSLATGIIGCIYPGCTDSAACNYDASAGCEDYSCYYPTCVDQFACNYDPLGCYGGTCTYAGCTDSLANNYNSSAGCDDGSCTYDPYGCSDSTACNYDPQATGTDCIYPGCDDSGACNYDPNAGCGDGSCLYYDVCGVCGGTETAAGCLDPYACNYDSNVQCDDGTCVYDCYGCTDSGAINYDPSALYDNGSCIYYEGCTNPSSCNYDPLAIYDNGTCVYDCFGCTDSAAINYNPSASIDDGSCLYYSGCTNPSACNYDSLAFYDNGMCIYDCLGCTDSYALNFNTNATIDDGSCVFYEGCTNPSACNYDSLAIFDNGSCIYDCVGCTDPMATNYNSTVSIDDGSCLYVIGCTYFGASNYDSVAYLDDGSCVFEENCPGDFDGNMEVNTADLLTMLQNFGTTCIE